jgi:hypothetical protein
MKCRALLTSLLALHAIFGSSVAAPAAAAAAAQIADKPPLLSSPRDVDAVGPAPNPWLQPQTLIPTGVAVSVTAVLAGVLKKLHSLTQQLDELQRSRLTKAQLDERVAQWTATLGEARANIDGLRNVSLDRLQLLRLRLHLQRLRREVDGFRDGSDAHMTRLGASFAELDAAVKALRTEVGSLWVRLIDEQLQLQPGQEAQTAQRWSPPPEYFTNARLAQCVRRSLTVHSVTKCPFLPRFVCISSVFLSRAPRCFHASSAQFSAQPYEEAAGPISVA